MMDRASSGAPSMGKGWPKSSRQSASSSLSSSDIGNMSNYTTAPVIGCGR